MTQVQMFARWWCTRPKHELSHTSMIMVGVLQSSCAVVVHCMAVAVTSRVSTMPTDANVTEICPAMRLHHQIVALV